MDTAIRRVCGVAKMMKIALPYPPASGNTTTRHTRGGGHYTKPEITRYRELVASLVRNESITPDWVSEDDRLECVMEVFAPDRRRRDLDNIVKVVADALTKAGAWHDDYAIDRLVLIRREPVKYGLVKVTASVIGKE